MISLNQSATTVRRTGGHLRLKQIQRFENLDSQNKETYQLFERRARQKADQLFPRASQVLRERITESIAIRRMRFLCYLDQR